MYATLRIYLRSLVLNGRDRSEDLRLRWEDNIRNDMEGCGLDASDSGEG
jgi:hypothetical protein